MCNPDIDGGNSSKENAGRIDVLAWSWGQSVGVFGVGGGTPREASQPNFLDLTITKSVDVASEDLFRHLVTGAPIPEVLEYREYPVCTPTCPEAEPYLTLRMSETLVSSLSGGGSADGQPTESVSFNFVNVSYCVKPLANDGTLSAPQCFAYSRSQGQSIAPL